MTAGDTTRTAPRLRRFADRPEASDELYGIADANYRYLWVNQAYLDRHGLELDAINDRSLPEVLGESYFRQVVKPRMDRCLAGEVQRFETERDYPGLGRRKLLVRYYPIRLPGQPGTCLGAVITDVTDIRADEAELARQSTMIELAGRAARFGGWFVDLENDRITWSDMVAEIHGMPHGYSPSIDEGIAFYAPEYRQRIRELFTACVEQGVPYDEELQILNANGQRVWVRTLGEPVHDENGRIIHAQGAFQDVTARREREQKLHKLAQITDQSPAAIAVTDLDGRIEYVNSAFEAISGYTREQLLGDTPARIKSGKTPESSYRDLWNTISAGKVWTGELQNRRSDGSLYWESEVISPLRDEQGRIVNYVAIKQDITALKEAERKLSQIAYEDSLTALHSRTGFSRQLQRRIEQDGWQAKSAVVMIDIAGQRDVNDVFGYEGGDQLLIEFGRRLQALAGEHGLTGRIGGDEFTMYLLPADEAALDSGLKQLLEFLTEPFELNGLEIEISIRLGYTRLGEHQRPVEDLLREAERALFQHRRESSATWIAYSAALQEATQQRIQLTRELRQALHEDQFELHFQPQVELATGRLVSCEALLRWNHPERGLIPPGVFLSIAEQSQLISPIGDWVLRRACQHLHDWREAGLEPVRVAVNVSLVQFHKGDFPSLVHNVLQQCRVAPQELALEITESVFSRESESLLKQMRALREMGVRLSLDDFGTGYSSLLYLQRYPFDEIKIDKGFVSRLLEDPFSRNIVETVMGLARALGAEVVAEGIESAAVSDALKAIGCRHGQGFFYSMPLEAEDFKWLLERRSTLPLAARKAR